MQRLTDSVRTTLPVDDRQAVDTPQVVERCTVAKGRASVGQRQHKDKRNAHQHHGQRGDLQVRESTVPTGHRKRAGGQKHQPQGQHWRLGQIPEAEHATKQRGAEPAGPTSNPKDQSARKVHDRRHQQVRRDETERRVLQRAPHERRVTDRNRNRPRQVFTGRGQHLTQKKRKCGQCEPVDTQVGDMDKRELETRTRLCDA